MTGGHERTLSSRLDASRIPPDFVRDFRTPPCHLGRAPVAVSERLYTSRETHLAEVSKRSFTDEQAETALLLSRAVGINQEINSSELNESVIFSPYVWGNQADFTG